MVSGRCCLQGEHLGILILVVVLVVLVVAGALTLILLRRTRTASLPVVETEPENNGAAREALHRVIEERGTELLDRRVDLDARRGTLAGDSQVYDAFDRLQAQFRSGDISEEEYEAGKICLLGG